MICFQHLSQCCTQPSLVLYEQNFYQRLLHFGCAVQFPCDRRALMSGRNVASNYITTTHYYSIYLSLFTVPSPKNCRHFRRLHKTDPPSIHLRPSPFIRLHLRFKKGRSPPTKAIAHPNKLSFILRLHRRTPRNHNKPHRLKSHVRAANTS